MLVGATTENPSFELNAALMSRAQVLILNRLDSQALCKLLDRAEALAGRPLPVTAEARDALVATADGDGRFLLNQAETLFSVDLDTPLDPGALAALPAPAGGRSTTRTRRPLQSDFRTSQGAARLDPQASLYYLARMLTAGEEPLYCRRTSASRARI